MPFLYFSWTASPSISEDLGEAFVPSPERRRKKNSKGKGKKSGGDPLSQGEVSSSYNHDGGEVSSSGRIGGGRPPAKKAKKSESPASGVKSVARPQKVRHASGLLFFSLLLFFPH